jgi:hypothetical protein
MDRPNKSGDDERSYRKLASMFPPSTVTTAAVVFDAVAR